MKKLLVLLALAFGFAYFYPIRHEQADNACAALDKRIATLLAAQTPTLGAMAAPHLGDVTAAYVQARFPLLPRETGCVLAYWGTTLKPDLARAAIGAAVLGSHAR